MSLKFTSEHTPMVGRRSGETHTALSAGPRELLQEAEGLSEPDMRQEGLVPGTKGDCSGQEVLRAGGGMGASDLLAMG